LLSLIRSRSLSGLPLYVDVHPTTRCNLECRWCVNKTNKDTAASETMNDVNIPMYLTKLLEPRPNSPSYSPKRIHFCGGEPLLRRSVVLAGIRFLEGKDIAVSLVTNGTLLIQEVRLAVLGVESLQVSIDAQDRETYARLKRGDYFEQVLRNLEALANLRSKSNSSLRLVVNYVLCRDNINALHPFLTRLSNIGVDKIQFRTDLTADLETQRALLQEVIGLKYEAPLSVIIKSPDTPVTRDSFDNCLARFIWIVLGSDLSIYPCAHTVARGFQMGSLIDSNLFEVLEKNIKSPNPNCLRICPSTCGNINLLGQEILDQ